ncbi:hypothetical protein NOK12_16450 [Nocardioides sp. OK12]|uniref:hypothetical protein n=1 Tax=Nocardioides sp. OK12 TaxID=2758661 RepID=UPI0021C36054|nr:hypothetical protein [Nocardioides sp. OK12]GHJ59127.1 hypothetical protein NOK12_16450 [Nocardioides sp. OK12]
MSADIRLDFGPIGGSLDLVNADGVSEFYWFSTLADGFNLGSPEASRIIVSSLLRDGDDERIDRYGNRTITFDVQVHGTSAFDVGRGERALSLLVGKRTLLRWTPPGGMGSLTRFVVLTSEMAPLPDDLAELGDTPSRTWRLTLTCEPHGTSETPTSQTFAPSTVEPTVQDNASTLARWSVVAGQGTLTTSTYGDGTSVRDQVMVVPGSLNGFGITYTAPSAPVANFIGIDVANSSGVTIGPSAPPVAIEPGANYTRYWFDNPGTASVTFSMLYDASGQSGPNHPHYFYVGGLYSSSTLNGRGLVVTEVEGSVRTEGTLTMTRASGMTWLTAFVDPAMLTHGYSPSVAATWPLAPAGRYMLAVKNAQTATASGKIVGTITDSSGLVQTASTVSRSATNAFRPIGEFMLGSRRDGLLGALTITVTREGTAVASPELRLFRLDDDTSLTMFEPAASVTEVVLESPSLDNPVGALWANGFAASNKAVAFEVPILPPGALAIFVEANDSATSPVTTTVDYWEKWRTFAP